MKCRCGHGQQWHKRASGHKRLPCQFKSGSPYSSVHPEVRCKCRDWHPVEP